MRFKTLIYAVVFSLCIYIPASHALVVSDPTQIKIQLLDEVKQLNHYKTMLEQLYLKIKSFQHLDFSLKRNYKMENLLQFLIESYENLSKEYNRKVGSYNSLAEMYNNLNAIENIINEKCNSQNSCTYEELKELNDARIHVFKEVNKQLQYAAQNRNELKDEIDSDLDYLKNKVVLPSINDKQEADLLIAQYELLAVLTEQVMKLRKDLNQSNYDDLKIQSLKESNESNEQLRMLLPHSNIKDSIE